MKARMAHVSNSSTDSFICRAEYTVYHATQILTEMLDYYNKLFNTELKFENVFKNPRLGTEKCYIDHSDFSDCLQREEIIGKLIIQGKEDNSIPYALFELISQKFNANRIHMG